MTEERKQLGPAVVEVKITMDDPHGLTGADQTECTLKAAVDQTLLDVMLDHGINIEHACGGVCACSTCHVYIKDGMDSLCESTEAEEDRVEEAPAVKPYSRLSCQCRVTGDGPIHLHIPGWNRNAVKEVPH
jgi:2Fe-2S ferredoxin